MQRKKLLAIGIALALQTSYYPAMAADNTDDDNKCPTNISSLSQAEREKLPAECLITKVEQDNHWGWAAGGIAALAASVALGVHNSDSDGNSHHTVSPTPSDDGGDVTPTPPDDTSIISYSNGVTDDRGADTLSFNDIKLDNGKHLGPAMLSYSKQDERWQLTTLSGKTLNVSGWNVTDDNAAVIEGTQENGLYWKYDSRGYLILADDQTQVTTGDNETHATDRGMTVSGANKTGVIISGDNTTNTISGGTSVDGAIGALISGSNSSTTLSGNINVSGGGTGMVIDGNRTIIDNTGTSTISGEGSTGLIILGDNTRLINDGELEVSDGATGAKIVGDGAIVDNTGNSTTRGAGSTGLYIEGDDAYVVNAGDQTITDGATGTHIKGDNARMMNAGNVHVDGAGSTVAVIDGNNAKLTQNGDLLVTNGAMGIITNGQGVTLTNNGNITVHDEGSTGFVVAGEQNTLTNKGDIDVSLNGTGALVSGTESDVNLSGDINVDSVQDSDGVFQGATGVNVSGSDNAVNILGNVNVGASYAQDSLISDEIPLNGIAITGNNNDVTLDGTLNLNASDLSNVAGQTQDITGLDIQGDDNNVNITGGLNITATGSTNDENSAIQAININGNSKVTLSGHSTADLTTIIGGNVMLAKVQNGGQLVLDENSSVDIDMNFLGSGYVDYNALLVASGGGSDIENQGTINDNGAAQLLMARDGAHVANSGAITAWTKDNFNNGVTRAGIIIAGDTGSVSENKAGGNITLLSDQKPFDSGGISVYPLKWYGNTYYAMLAYNYGEVSNDAGATIMLQGAGVYGVSAAKGTASNAGDIYLDGFVPTLDDAGNITSKTFWQPANLNITSAGMVAGSTDSGNGDATATNTGTITVNNAGVIKNGSVDKGGTLNNLEGGTMTLQDNGLWSGTFNNWGTVNSDADIATGGSGHTLYNGTTGVINGQITTSKNNGGSKAINDGTINIDKTGNVAMSAHGSAKMVNNGTINVGTQGTEQTGMIGMQLESDAKADAVIENNGTINIYANNSYAFSQLGSNGHIVNNGTVYIDDSVTGSGFIKQNDKTIEGSGEYGAGTEVHYVDFTAPTEPTIDDSTTTMATGDISTSSGTNNLSGYIVGTSADGSAGKLMVSNASLDGVEINTGFTAGTADTTVTFDNVVEGSNLSDAGAIQSTTVVWNAQGSTDSSGNVDVTMTKNAYADVATDSSVSDVAQALDAGYTNNELYTSLNVGTTAELNNALKQISGSQATTVFREARILSNRFTMLADAAPQIKDGLAFNVVAKGDPRAELGNDTQYDMLALRQTLDLTASQNLTLEYGIARLDGDGSQKAGDNGLTGGYSQFFGLKHNMAFGEGLAWNNSLRYDVHNLDSSRSVDYSDVNKVADSDARQQYMEFRSEGAKTFSLMDDALKVTPYAGVKFRHTMEDGYKERSAGDFNLSMNSGNETAVDSLVGLNLDYTGKDGWSATATLEGGPNLSYNKSQRTASLQGAAGQSFSVDDGQKGGGVNGQATIGVKYSSNDTVLHLDAYQWKEDSISDKGFMLNVKKTFR